MKSLTTKASLAINPDTIDIAKGNELAKFIALQKELTSQIEAVWSVIYAQMDARGIKQVKGDWGTLSVAERMNWQADATVPPRFFKQVVDGRKLKLALEDGKLPAGASFTTSHYLSRRIK